MACDSNGYRINAKADRHEILLYGEIGGWFGGVDAETVAKDLAGVPKSRPLDVRINSGGGDVFAALAISTHLRERQTTVYVDGVAASAASLIAASGREVVMARGARLMIHDPWAVVMGNAGVLRTKADLLESVRADMVDLYTGFAGEQHRAAIDLAMAAETWYSATEAVAAGLATRVESARAALAASIAQGRYQRTPADLLTDGGAWRAAWTDRQRRLDRARGRA